ncbi:phospholipid carrier-dependent glycosyltransferase [Marinomonas sp.]|uniref:phospholipid carrier-dependent glycosyltransferase n=1 Tax=Marinomonas sp. TaxID=1904862 RepID=UPI003BA85FE0
MYRSQYKWLLLLAFVVLYLLPLGLTPLWMPDEVRYAEISREMLATGNWVVPHFMGMDYFEKPVLGYWMNNISQLLFGQTNFAARLAPALSIGLTGWITYYFVKSALKDERKAFYSALVYLSIPLVFGVGTYNTLDSQLTLWMAAAFASFYFAMNGQNRSALVGRYLLFGVFCGAAFLTKGFVGLAILVIAIVPFMIVTRQFKQVVGYGTLSILAAVLIALPWSIAVAIQAPDYWNFFFWNENIRRFESNNAQHLAPFWYYIPTLLLAVFPWTVLAPHAIARSFADKDNKRFFLYQACCVVLPFILLSIARGKLATYIMPLMMPLAILIGCGLVELIKQKHVIIKWSVWINLLAFSGIALVLVLVQYQVLGKVEGYQAEEIYTFWFAIGVFFFCALLPLLPMKKFSRVPFFLAGTSVALLLLLPFFLPMKVVNNKHPEVFYEQHISLIDQDAWVITNYPGLIGGLGWILDRSDIDLLESYGELEYGVKRSEQQRYFRYDEFREQLKKRQHSQQVVLAFYANPTDAHVFKELPAPAQQYQGGNFHLYIYPKLP